MQCFSKCGPQTSSISILSPAASVSPNTLLEGPALRSLPRSAKSEILGVGLGKASRWPWGIFKSENHWISQFFKVAGDEKQAPNSLQHSAGSLWPWQVGKCRRTTSGSAGSRSSAYRWLWFGHVTATGGLWVERGEVHQRTAKVRKRSGRTSTGSKHRNCRCSRHSERCLSSSSLR